MMVKLLKGSALGFFIIFFSILPIAFALIPVVPAVITDNDHWALFMIITFPVGIGCAGIVWEHGYDWAFEMFSEYGEH
jgi:hypothetical protein